MKAKLSPTLIAALIAAPAFAAPELYTVDPKHTLPSFEVNHLGFSTQRGRFNSSSGKITLDRAAKQLDVDIIIDVKSVDTGVEKLEQHLKEEDFFFVEKYPTITFKSTGAKFDGDKPVSVDGLLTMRGVTKPVTLAVTSFKCGPNVPAKKDGCGADAETTVKRSDFGISYALPAVGDEVKLKINIEALKD